MATLTLTCPLRHERLILRARKSDLETLRSLLTTLSSSPSSSSDIPLVPFRKPIPLLKKRTTSPPPHRPVVVDPPPPSPPPPPPPFKRVRSDPLPQSSQSCGAVVETPPRPCPPAVFYGQANTNVWEDLLMKTRLYRSLLLRKQPRPPTHIPTWTWFPRQAMAFDYCATSCDPELVTFAYEGETFTGRRFLVANYDVFWRSYWALSPLQRHHYEVIREGTACHLYFDLEFPRSANPDIDGDAMVDRLFVCLNEHLMKDYALLLAREDVVLLDSSTETKFSQHLICHVSGAVFENNIVMGHYVKKLVHDNQDAFSVYDTKGKTISFVDLGVYTRNRMFRLCFSTKLGMSSALLPAPQNCYPFNTERDLFLASLVCNTQCVEGLRLLTWHVSPSIRTLTRAEAEALHRVQPVERHLMSIPSPFPQVDQFIGECVRKRGGVEGVIRSSTYSPGSSIVVYQIGRNRFCENIQRQHKSNHILIVADIRRGVYYQKCLDPECRAIDYRSPEQPLPLDLLPYTRTIPDGQQQQQLQQEEEEEHVYEDIMRMVAALEASRANAPWHAENPSTPATLRTNIFSAHEEDDPSAAIFSEVMNLLEEIEQLRAETS